MVDITILGHLNNVLCISIAHVRSFWRKHIATNLPYSFRKTKKYYGRCVISSRETPSLSAYWCTWWTSLLLLLCMMFMQIEINFFNIIYRMNLSSFSKTQEYRYYLSYFWANDNVVRIALGIKEVGETNLVLKLCGLDLNWPRDNTKLTGNNGGMD
jgi:hypothetical protein